MLWQRSLVMRDLETKSLWSHLLGKAMDGKLKGTSLELIPAVMTTWSEWKQRHPNTTVLAMPRTAKRFTENVWEQPERYVFGVTPHAAGKAYSASIPLLQKKKIIQISDDKQALLFTFSEKGKRVQVFSRAIDGKPLEFTGQTSSTLKHDTIIDSETKSTWNLVTGECTKGPHKGRKLQPIAGTISFKRAWQVFFPDGKMLE